MRQAQIKDKENTDTLATPVANILTPFAPLGLLSTAAQPLKCTHTATDVSYGDAPVYDNELQKAFHNDLCKLMVANGWAW